MTPILRVRGGGGGTWVEYTHMDIKKRHGYGVELTLIEPKLIHKEGLAIELPVGVGFDLNRMKENSGPSEIASNIV